MSSVTTSRQTNKTDNSSKKIRIGMLSLGCPKTLVDSEVILGKLDSRYALTTDVNHCDVALLNTCSFIHDAQKESIDRMMGLLELKKQKKISSVIVMGCMVQEFPNELKKELKEVDAFIGSGEYAKIPAIVEQVTKGEKVFSVGSAGYLSTAAEKRVALTPKHYRYLKISEGCDHICSFCTIPSFRGKHRSRRIDDVVKEAKNLITQGAREIILTGQDTTYFGRDWDGKFWLPDLIHELDQVKGMGWIRLLYAYPSCLPTELMEAMQKSKHLCHYLDMPLQHASDNMLLSMRRGITKRRTIDLIEKFRSIVPDLAIRTTFIVGFPGETEADFAELLEFMEQQKFTRVGIFKYSQETGSHAASLSNQISEKVKEFRYHKAMQLQQKISRDVLKSCVGKTLQVLVEEKGEKHWIGRSYMDAPEIDGNVLIHSTKSLPLGNFVPIKITATEDYDLVGQI